MKLPQWLDGELGKIGQRSAERAISRAEAVTAIRDVIIRQDDPAFLRGVVSEFAARALDSWHREHRGSSAVTLAGAQSELFPELPARLFIRPGTAKAVILFTGHDWDTAKAVLENRTSGSINAAKADWAAFEAAYARVRPLLTAGLTTADVADEIRGAA